MSFTRSFSVLSLSLSFCLALAGVPARAEVLVNDASGQSLGQLLDIHIGSTRSSSETIVKLFVPEIARYITIDTVTGALAQPAATLWYAARGCTGQAYVDESLFYSVAPMGRGFITSEDKPPMLLQPISQYRIGANGNGVCTSLTRAPSLAVVPAAELRSLPFRTPIQLPLAFHN